MPLAKLLLSPSHPPPPRASANSGDYTFPGIGVPATAASGAIMANPLLSIPQHWRMLDKLKLPIKA